MTTRNVTSADFLILQQTCIPRTIFHKQIDVDLLQSDAHAGTLEVRQHHKLDIRRRLVVVQFVLAGGERHEAVKPMSGFGSRG